MPELAFSTFIIIECIVIGNVMYLQIYFLLHILIQITIVFDMRSSVSYYLQIF
jgi:hypothetical protein